MIQGLTHLLMVGLESMQGMQREFQTICLTKLSNTCRQTQVQAGGRAKRAPLLVMYMNTDLVYYTPCTHKHTKLKAL